MKIIFISFVFTNLLLANLFDDINIFKASSALGDKDYKSAFESYDKVQNKSDEINYNIANTLYKQKKYEEAILHYDKISSKDLQYKKLHNLGNTYAQLDKIDYAIKKYEEALKINKNKDTQFNLDLLIKKKQEDEKKKEQDKKDKKDKKDEGKDNKDKNKSDQDSKQKKKKEESDKNEDEKEVKEKKDNNSNNQDKAKDSKKEEIKKQEDNNTKEENVKNTDLSHLEEKRWTKMLNNRELNTLMIPLKTKGEKNEQNINPW